MTADPTIIAALAHDTAALTAYLNACDAKPASDTEQAHTMPAPAKPTRSRKVAKPATTKVAKPASKARAPKDAPTTWTVNPAWAGVPASPRMMAAALYWGVPTATCNKLKTDKLALSLEIAKVRGIPVA